METNTAASHCRCCAHRCRRTGMVLFGGFTGLFSLSRIVIQRQEKGSSDPDYIPINSRFKCVQGTELGAFFAGGGNLPLLLGKPSFGGVPPGHPCRLSPSPWNYTSHSVEPCLFPTLRAGAGLGLMNCGLMQSQHLQHLSVVADICCLLLSVCSIRAAFLQFFLQIQTSLRSVKLSSLSSYGMGRKLQALS